MNTLTRRSFLKTSALVTAGTALSARSWAQVAGANGDIRVAVVGFGGRGGSHISAFSNMPGVRLVALCEEEPGSPAGVGRWLADRALRIVQSLDPPGIGARDLKECLLLQLADDDHKFELERLLVANHLDDLRLNRYPKIVKETGRTMEEIRRAAEMVCHLNPRPGAVFSEEQPHYVLPDVRVVEENGEYHVLMCDDYIPRLRLSSHYISILKSPDSSTEEKEYIKKKLQSAKWIMDAIEQRRSTLKRIVEEVVKVQREFFEKGIRFLKPLRMASVAEAAGVHLSTVSRAISDKYVDTPRGLYEIRFFFAGRAE
jgi:RNA polymerase sigma-54 factor